LGKVKLNLKKEKEKNRIKKLERGFEPPLGEAEQPPSVWKCSVTPVIFRSG
jgi:hypothetical protein